jgi:threonine dehydrogenase-like Zn-dependent dehydrogenase
MMPIDGDDSTIAIYGLGKMGFLIQQVAKNLGLQVLTVVGSEEKMGLSKKLGADYIINRHKNNRPSKEITKIWNGADVVVDTTGDPDIIDELIASCRSRGKIHIKSTPGTSSCIDLTEMVRREIILYTSRCGPFKKAIKELLANRILVNPLTSNVVPLEKAKIAFKTQTESSNNIRTILTIRS